ncbi:winged helix DNA-binding domain-containing protein [Streptomyces sp. NPDC048629]|uniref:winged helix DNA-binding domain-containing protein n=1 Tax=Streptomyces sp. NPDC048629 TaxID=3154824 RepID=UPI0034146C14
MRAVRWPDVEGKGNAHVPESERDRRVRYLRAWAQAIGGGVREDDAAAVVRRVFAVQAQDATAARLGIRARSRAVDGEAVRVAYEDDRSIVRGWFMRGTLHTVPAPDVRWLLRLLGPRLLRAGERRYRELELDEALRERADDLLKRAVTTHGPLTRAELTERLAPLGVPPTGQAAFHLIRHAALRGILVHGPERAEGEYAGEATFVLLDDWLPDAGAAFPEDAAAELARRYLKAYAPADAADFAAWAGLPAGVARTAWRALADAGASAEYAGLTVPARRATQDADETDTPDVRLLPAYDNYFTGYRTRELSVPAAHEKRVWPGGGVLRPTVTVDGLAVATWSRQVTKEAADVRVEPFAPLSREVRDGLAEETAAVSRFLRPE